MRARHNPYFRRLLVAFDGSPQSKKAVEVAMQLSACLDAEIVVFAVAQLPKPATMAEVRAALDDAREHYNAAFEKLVNSAKECGLEMKTEIAVGRPADQIIRRAEGSGIDMVLLGHRRASRFRKLVMGSISAQVLKYAHCPVMFVG
jgi:nucleotide-binding universal stress UspA family protein